jgi:outer membrane protein TolC
MKQYISLLLLSLFAFPFLQAQTLQELVNEAMSNSPEIKKFELQYNIANEKVNEVNTLPNTEFGVGYFVSEPETRTGAQRFRLSAKQMLPWFGSITTRENYANSLADAKYEDIVIAKRKLTATIAQSYYKLYANKAKQQVLLENIDLLNTYETLALTSIEVGKASAVDVLRLQMRQNELEQLKKVLEQQFLGEVTTLNLLLNRDKDLTIDLPETLIVPDEPLPLNTDQLLLHPELIKYDKLYSSVSQSQLLNKKESSPMIGFGLDYINVENRPDMSFSDNGKDIVMPMVSLSIPIFNNSFKSKSKQNELAQQEIKVQKTERQNTLEARLYKAISERNAASITLQTQTKNLKQAKDAEQILVKSYETGTIDFNDVLDIQELQLKFQVNRIEAVVNYYLQSTIINYLTQ